MSRSGPYALLLLAALSFLVSTRPDWWGGALVAVGVEVDVCTILLWLLL